MSLLLCVRCECWDESDDKLNHVCVEFISGERKVHSVQTLTQQQINLEINDLLEEEFKKIASSLATYLHISCQTYLKTNTRSIENFNKLNFKTNVSIVALNT